MAWTTLQRFGHLTDHQVLQQSFELSDPHELVARQSGFESWQTLNKGVQAMTDPTPAVNPSTSPTTHPTSTPVTTPERETTSLLIGLEAQLFVSDVDAACQFYVEKVGFTVAFTYGEPAFYGQVRRDGISLNLRLVDGPVFAGDIRQREHLLSATILLASGAELRQLFLEYESAGVSFHQPLRQEPWGARTFITEDPDGNLLLFTGPAV